MLRSFLFIPGDSAKKIAKGAASAADALILDLEDSVSSSNREDARALVREVLSGARNPRQQLWVRINPLDTADAPRDLASVVPARPDGIIVPKIDGPADIARLAHDLDALERAHQLAAGQIRIMPVATETPASVFALGHYKGVSARLLGLTWGAEDLAAALGASANRDPDGKLLPTFQIARMLCLTGAYTANVLAIETVFPDFRNLKGLEDYAREGRRDGFRGMMAVHPDQVDIINAAFMPDEAEIAWAKRVVDAFAAAGTGVVGLDGQMLDMPHLKQAQNILAQVS